jgi:photosystem II stability/assembly factor-like uncharacterized protein
MTNVTSMRQRFLQLAPLLLILVVAFAVFAVSPTQSHASTTADLASPFKLKNITTLGPFGPGGITMANEQVGWTLDGKGLQRTSDGGRTWQTVAHGTANEVIQPVFVLNGQTAWYTTINTNTLTTTALYRTNDGGKSWTRFQWISSTQFLIYVSIPDQNTAWISTSDASGNQYLYLVGGSGQRFREVTLPGPNQLQSLYFTSQVVGWATEPTADGSSAMLFTTRDGGQNWTQQSLPLPAGAPATDTVSLNFLGFSNQKQGDGYLTATFSDPATGAIDATQIYASLDDGQSWQIYGSFEPANVFIVAQIDPWHITASNVIFVTPGEEQNLGILQSGVWTVQSIALPDVAQPDNNGAWLTVLNSRVMFISAFNADSSAQILYKTQDGGITWQRVASVPFN